MNNRFITITFLFSIHLFPLPLFLFRIIKLESITIHVILKHDSEIQLLDHMDIATEMNFIQYPFHSHFITVITIVSLCLPHNVLQQMTYSR